jgi:alkylation response protein AidB-like acyl-CoA dehydrogenase
MDVLFNETEELLRKSAREMLEIESPAQLVREMEVDPQGYSPDLWKKMAELGWLGMAIPEAYGGQELGLTYLGIVAEELGRAVSPVPFHSTMTAALAITADGTDEQRQRILPLVNDGKAILTWAFTEDDPRLIPSAIKLEAKSDGSDFVLSGTKRFVEFARAADHCLVACRTKSGTNGEDGISLLLVDMRAYGIGYSPLNTQAKDSIADVTFKDVRVPQANVVGTLHAGWPAVQQMLDRGTALICAQMAGAARKTLELAVEYAKHRVAFGRPIGSFQTIAHTLADMLIWVDGAELLTYEALWRLENGLDATAEVSQAKAFCSEKCLATARNANVVHGGLALTAELNLNLWFRRIATWSTRLGTPIEHRRRVANAILGPAA